MPHERPPATAQAEHTRAWAVVRLVLGLAQRGGTVVSLILLICTGITTGSLTAVLLTSLCTTVSVLLFGGRRTGR
jgi:hypothetical protein